jgi:hypothetical protein
VRYAAPDLYSHAQRWLPAEAVYTPVWTSFRPDPTRSLKIPANHLENRRDHQSKKAKRQRREEAAVD